MLKCVMCGFTAVSTDAFIEHVTNSHEKPAMNRKQMCCKFCPFRSPEDREMEEHVRNCRKDPASDIETGETSRMGKKARLDEKADQGSGRKKVQIRCKSCDFVSADKARVVEHFLAAHIDRKFPDEDKEAAVTTDVKGGLSPTPEVEAKPAGEAQVEKKTFRCRHCGFQTGRRKKFASHLARKHPSALRENDEAEADVGRQVVIGEPSDQVDASADAGNRDLVDEKPAQIEPGRKSRRRHMKQCRHCVYRTFDVGTLTRHLMVAHSELTPDKKKKKTNADVFKGKLKTHKRMKHRGLKNDVIENKENDKPESSESLSTGSEVAEESSDITTSDSVSDAGGVKVNDASSAKKSKKKRDTKPKLDKKVATEKRKKAASVAKKSLVAKIGCKQCNFLTTSVAEIFIHTKKEHSNIDKSECPDASSKSNSPPKLLFSPGEEFTCSKCSVFKTSRLFELAHHFTSCSGEKRHAASPSKTGGHQQERVADLSHETASHESTKMEPSLTSSYAPAGEGLDHRREESDVESKSSLSVTSEPLADSETDLSSKNFAGGQKSESSTESNLVGEKTEAEASSVENGFARKHPVDLGTSALAQPEQSNLIQEPEVTRDEVESSSGGRGQPELPTAIRDFQCSQCEFSAARLKDLAIHFVTCRKV